MGADTLLGIAERTLTVRFVQKDRYREKSGYTLEQPELAKPTSVNWLIPNEGGWRGWRVGLGVGVEVFT